LRHLCASMRTWSAHWIFAEVTCA